MHCAYDMIDTWGMHGAASCHWHLCQFLKLSQHHVMKSSISCSSCIRMTAPVLVVFPARFYWYDFRFCASTCRLVTNELASVSCEPECSGRDPASLDLDSWLAKRMSDRLSVAELCDSCVVSYYRQCRQVWKPWIFMLYKYLIQDFKPVSVTR